MRDQRRRHDGGSTFESQFAYSRAVCDGRLVHVSGTTGYDYGSGAIDPDPGAQTHQCFRNIQHALAQLGSDLSRAVRVRYIIANAADVDACTAVFPEYMSEARPAATLLIAGLLDPAMKIEIELTALTADAREADAG
ncbi:MAG: RidA family protein [Pseudomonadota bacterium]